MMNRFKQSTYIFGIVTLILMCFLASGAGIGGDEDVNYKYAGYVLDYFTGGENADKAFSEVRGPDYAYHFTFDLPVEILNRIFDFDDIHQARHYWSAIIGWGVIMLIFIIGRKYFDVWTGMIAGSLLLMSPRFIGHAVNNTRDVPFAFGYVLGMYGIFSFAENFKKPTWRTTLLCMLCIGIALNSRIGAFILFPFLGLVTIIQIWFARKSNFLKKKYWAGYGKLILHMLVIFLGAYAMLLLFWPFGQKAPFSNPMKSFQIMSDFAIGIRQLFEGVNVSSTQLPWYYTMKWILISTPIIFLTGLITSLVYLLKKRKRSRKVIYSSLLAFALIPIVYIFYKGSNVYGGWRHSIFIYPSLTLLSAIGLRYAYKAIKNPIASNAFAGLGVLLSLLPIIHVVKNYPVHYVYFNEIVGGAQSAYGNYEMDYYMHSVKPGCDWLIDEGIVNENDSLIIASNHQYSTDYYNRNFKKTKVIYTRYYERLKKEWDYAVYVNVYIDQPELMNGAFPPTGTIHTIDVDGKPICAVVKNPSNAAVGYDLDLKDKNYRAALNKLRSYNNVDNNNFENNMNLAMAYQGLKRMDSLNFFLQKAKAINPQRLALYTRPRK